MRILRAFLVLILTWEARLVLYRHLPKIIAVTGSVGKTTTKDAIYAAISGRIRVRKSLASFNSEIGVPLTILGLGNPWSNPFLWLSVFVKGFLIIFAKDYPEWLILEVGADRPGDIRRIAKWLKPDIVVFTGVPEIPVHVEYFDSPEAVFREKRTLIEYLKPGGALILNGDDIRAKELKAEFRGLTTTYGFEEGCDFLASREAIEYKDGPVGLYVRVDHAGSSVPLSIQGALGRPRIYGALAALAVSDVMHIDVVSAAGSLAHWTPPPGRMRIIPGKNGSTIIDDTYNSSPVAALSALDTLKEVQGKRRIAILGDMMELGKYSAAAHRTVGERAAQCADQLVTIGFRARAIGEVALDGGMPEKNIREYEQREATRAGHELSSELKEGDIVLVKGSQSMRMERTVELLIAHPETAKDTLVRQDEEWLAKP
ncbi:UDP-N-acetylmuramoyl-tripeptide--D-alanyl-D-alanine ligase [Candidatus Kaiserbacteria bacterium]|nr:UDP-N-acetylmuramoyl-tripeptide--D-alanyl-D-alanine ligase [Candidatus Kaiserbacteria bacterium]